MNLPLPTQVRKLSRIVSEDVRKCAPQILSGGAIIGLATTVYFTWNAKPKCDEILKERREKLAEIEGREELIDKPEAKKSEVTKTNLDTAGKIVQATAPMVISIIVTTVCIVMADRINYKRLAAATAMYDISSEVLKRYRLAVSESDGDSKDKAKFKSDVREKVAKETIKENPPEECNILSTGKGDLLYLDVWSGRYFRSCKTAIEDARNKLNEQLIGDVYVSLNEFYDMLGLPGIKFGEEHGFDVNKGLLIIDYTYGETPSGEHCIIVDYDLYTRYRFGDY